MTDDAVPPVEFPKADALRRAADVITKIEPLKPYISAITVMAVASSMSDFKALCRALGTFKKTVDDNFFNAVVDCGNEVQVHVFIARDSVCKRIVLGTEQVPEEVIPAQAEQRIPAHTKTIYGWDCAPSLMGPDEQHPGPDWPDTVTQEVATLPDRMDASAGEPAPTAPITDDDMPF